ncbi:MAG: hypothetical protein LBJ94_00655 [Puniceicoccales bacterium]|jgi:hypothetical protein|nr:hypothetical protein [Puniceicoccales bacterium]
MLAANWVADPQRYSLAPTTLAEMNNGQTPQYHRYKPRCCKFNDPTREREILATDWLADLQRYSLAPATPAEMNNGQISQYQEHKPRCCKFDDPTRKFPTSLKCWRRIRSLTRSAIPLRLSHSRGWRAGKYLNIRDISQGVANLMIP